MSTAYQALTNSYINPSRQLGAVSSRQELAPIDSSNDTIVKQNIVDQVFPPSQRTTKAGWNASALQVIIDALNQGYIAHYYDDAATTCTKANSSGNTSLQLANKAASLAGSGVGLAVGTATHASILSTLGISAQIAPVVGTIIGGAILAFAAISSIFQHHAQAVAQEQTILCYVIPKINEAIFGLDDAIARGTISLQDAYQGIDLLHQQFIQVVQPILQQSASTCNAACVMDRVVIALLLYKKYQYNVVVSSSPVSEVANQIASATGLPIQTSKTLMYVILIVLGFFILKGF